MTTVIFLSGKYQATDGTLYHAGETADFQEEEADSVVMANIAEHAKPKAQEIKKPDPKLDEKQMYTPRGKPKAVE